MSLASLKVHLSTSTPLSKVSRRLLKTPGVPRVPVKHNSDELAAIEALDSGKTFIGTKNIDVKLSISTIRYYAGWADKIHGQVVETHENNFSYTRHEPLAWSGR